MRILLQRLAVLRNIEAFQLLLAGNPQRDQDAKQLQQHVPNPAVTPTGDQPSTGDWRWIRKMREASERVAVGFAGANPQGVIDRRHEDLAVADLAGARAGSDDLDRLVGEI